jgi:hypothetical protein
LDDKKISLDKSDLGINNADNMNISALNAKIYLPINLSIKNS